MKKIIFMLGLVFFMLIAGCTIRDRVFYINNQFVAGYMNLTNNSVITSIASADVWYNVTYFGAGSLYDFTESGGGMIAQKSGLYYCRHDESYSGGANIDYSISISVNGDVKYECQSKRKLGANGDIGNSGMGCYININSMDNITLAVYNIDNTNDLTLDTASFSCERKHY